MKKRDINVGNQLFLIYPKIRVQCSVSVKIQKLGCSAHLRPNFMISRNEHYAEK